MARQLWLAEIAIASHVGTKSKVENFRPLTKNPTTARSHQFCNVST